MIPIVPIAQMLPHAGAMVFIDEIVYADPMRIECRTRVHRRPGFPLTIDGRVPSLCGIEIAAQAMALHAALQEPAAHAHARAGRLASLSEVEILHDRLDDRPEALRVEASLEHAGAKASAYRFSVAAGSDVLVRGRALVARVEAA